MININKKSKSLVLYAARLFSESFHRNIRRTKDTLPFYVTLLLCSFTNISQLSSCTGSYLTDNNLLYFSKCRCQRGHFNNNQHSQLWGFSLFSTAHSIIFSLHFSLIAKTLSVNTILILPKREYSECLVFVLRGP